MVDLPPDSNLSAGFAEAHQAALQADDEYMDLLPPDFEPGKWDVICQRGKECFDHGKY
jgi:hypothetical protein